VHKPIPGQINADKVVDNAKGSLKFLDIAELLSCSNSRLYSHSTGDAQNDCMWWKRHKKGEKTKTKKKKTKRRKNTNALRRARLQLHEPICWDTIRSKAGQRASGCHNTMSFDGVPLM